MALFTLSLTCCIITLAVAYTANKETLDMQHPQMANVYGELRNIKNKLALSNASFIRQSPQVYEYKLNFLDGREWKQTVDAHLSTQNPLLTFNITGSWLLSELVDQRVLRTALLELVGGLDVTSLTCAFK